MNHKLKWDFTQHETVAGTDKVLAQHTTRFASLGGWMPPYPGPAAGVPVDVDANVAA